MSKGPDGCMDTLEWAKFVIRTRDENNYGAAMAILSSYASKGNDEAEFYLGLIYARGQGVPRDFRLARNWLENASEQGNLNAMYFLGKMHDGG